MNHQQNVDIETPGWKCAGKPPRHYPLLSGFIVLSVSLHLCALMIWPSHIEPPAVGLTQLALEIHRQEPPGIRSVPPAEAAPARPQQKKAARLANQSPIKISTQATEPVRVKQRIADWANKSSSTITNDMQVSRQLTHAQIKEKLNGHIQKALLPHFSYPTIARRRGWEGIVRIGLRIENDGQLTNLHIVENSKFTALNRAALHSLQQVSGIPEAKQWLAGRHMDMVLPIQYRLLDS